MGAPTTPPLAVTLTVDQLSELIRGAVADAVAEMVPGQGPGEVLTRTEAAAFMRCSLTQLDRLSRTDGLPFHLLGDSRRFLRSELLDYLTRGCPSRRSEAETSQKQQD